MAAGIDFAQLRRLHPGGDDTDPGSCAMHPDGARLRSELALGPQDGMPEPCVASFDNLHTLRRSRFHQRITQLGPARLAELCPVFERALGCR